MRCPACGESLVVIERDQVEVDWCASCHGVWFDTGELNLLAEKAGLRLSPSVFGKTPASVAGEVPRKCPRCPAKMEKVRVGESKTIIDRCPEHGIWFDAGELGVLMTRLPEEGHPVHTISVFLGETLRNIHGGDSSPVSQ